MRRRVWLLALLSAVALLTAATALGSGCAVRLVAVHHPPAPVVVKPASPGPAHVWVKGHYAWRAGAYVWVGGRWEGPKVGQRWVRGHYKWARRGGHRVRVWVAGHWAGGKKTVAVKPRTTVKPRPKPVLVVKPAPRPRPVVVVRPAPRPVVVAPLPARPRAKRARAPGPAFFWVDGHFVWHGARGQYTWRPGRWEKKRRGLRWAPGRYEVRVIGPTRIKVWVDGQWIR